MNVKCKAILGVFVLAALASSLNAAPNPAATAETDMIEITKKVFPSVVRVEVQNGIRKVATGVVLDGNGHIVTTALISPRDEKIYVITSEGDKVDAEFLGMDAQTNLAVIKVKNRKLAPIEIGDIKNVEPGTWVGVVGMTPDYAPQVTQGICSSLGQDSLRLNVWVWKGASGSPVVDERGQMIGLLRGVYIDESPVVIEFGEKGISGSGYMFSRAEAPSSGLAVAVPLPVVEFVTGKIKEKGKVERGWLGVRTRDDEKGRVQVMEVTEDSPAAEGGLQEGDIIVEFDNMAVSGGEMLLNEVRRHSPGETVTLRVEREGKAQRVKVKLGEYTEQDIWRELEVKFPSLFGIPESLEERKVSSREFRFPPFEERIFKERSGVWTPFESRKYVGISIETLDEGLSEFFGLKEGVGILVRSVERNGPADKAGIKVGDLIVRADGKRVESNDEFIGLIQDKKKGETIRFEILRDKKKMTVDVEIEEDESWARPAPLVGWESVAENWGNAVDKGWRRATGLNRWFWDEYKEKMDKFRQELDKMSESFLREIDEKTRENGTFNTPSNEPEVFMNGTGKTYRYIKA